jgi:uncharacterized protein (TIGR02996 family)
MARSSSPVLFGPEVAPLLRAAKEEPEADAPRLVLADWLEDHGEAARAELIRLELEIARLAQDDPRVDALVKRQGDLLRRHKAEWLGPFLGVAADVKFRRGLLHVTISCRRCSASSLHRQRVLPAWEWIEGLDLGLEGGKVLARLESGTKGPQHWPRRPTWPSWPNWTSTATASGGGALALARSTALAGLTTLRLRDNRIGRIARAALKKRFGYGLNV